MQRTRLYFSDFILVNITLFRVDFLEKFVKNKFWLDRPISDTTSNRLGNEHFSAESIWNGFFPSFNVHKSTDDHFSSPGKDGNGSRTVAFR